MNTPSFASAWFCLAALGAFLVFSTPAHADATRNMVSQALDLVQQVVSDSKAMDNDQRIDLLTQALQLAQQAPPAQFRGHKKKAIISIKAAIDQLQQGDPNGAANEDIRRAADQLHDALSLAT
ncbi:MAG TPA: hypothetical protein VGC39_10330 [Candidatus Methylacidiphilales bacterium]